MRMKQVKINNNPQTFKNLQNIMIKTIHALVNKRRKRPIFAFHYNWIRTRILKCQIKASNSMWVHENFASQNPS